MDIPLVTVMAITKRSYWTDNFYTQHNGNGHDFRIRWMNPTSTGIFNVGHGDISRSFNGSYNSDGQTNMYIMF